LRSLKNEVSKSDNYGFENFDDCSIYTLDNGHKIIQSVDFFTPIVDDPFNFGQIAAANSLSDIYAMGGNPLFALNILAFPTDDLPNEVMKEILKGGQQITNEAKIPILGGHSIKDKEPKYGLVVTGESKNGSLIKNSTAQIEDILILTKPIGTGIITTAIKKGLASESQLNEAINIMTQLNSKASNIMLDFEINACTDITGYGLLGHLSEMCESSKVSAKIQFDMIKFLCGAFEFTQKNVYPGGSKRNLDYFSKKIDFNHNLTEHQKIMLADAQTSGGLLISCPPNRAKELKEVLSWDMDAFIIGSIIPKKQKLIYVD
tara:strand:+ start:2435 stop:3388 length:954 start_codon:yes stop_codon:yes gene_type:complete